MGPFLVRYVVDAAGNYAGYELATFARGLGSICWRFTVSFGRGRAASLDLHARLRVTSVVGIKTDTVVARGQATASTGTARPPAAGCPSR